MGCYTTQGNTDVFKSSTVPVKLRIRGIDENIFFRRYETAYLDLDYQHLKNIAKKTGCIKPCKYKKYRLDWDRRYWSNDFKATEGFGLSATSNHTTVALYSYFDKSTLGF